MPAGSLRKTLAQMGNNKTIRCRLVAMFTRLSLDDTDDALRANRDLRGLCVCRLVH